MWSQIAAIAWAQLRTTRNHLPRTSVGSFLLGFIGLLWYGSFAGFAVSLAFLLPGVPLDQLARWLPVGLLGVFAFWQIVPLFTLTGGWSLQLKKLLPYPVRKETLFGLEVFLRVTTAPEMLIILTGGTVGLLRNPKIGLNALALLLFIPLNLFLSLAVREWVLHGFARNRFREIFTILIVSVGILPQLLTRTPMGHRIYPYLLRAAASTGTPWREAAVLALGTSRWYLDLLFLAGWTYVCYFLARRQFERTLTVDQPFRIIAADELSARRTPKRSIFTELADIPSRLFRDPLGALLQKEYRTLMRMPRFRVMFGMACVFSVLVFIPMALNSRGKNSFMSNNFLVVTTLYGLLILSDSLLLNCFGFDRAAAQIYFVSPIPFRTVLLAKNLTAITFVAFQSVGVVVVALLLRVATGPLNVLNAVAAAAVVGTFFLAAGNLTSITMARPVDPAETFRKQAGGKMQLWFLLCAFAMFLLIGLAFLAGWALDTNWAMLAVLGIELLVGYIAYRVAMQSALERADTGRERLIDSLSKGANSSVVSLGMS